MTLIDEIKKMGYEYGFNKEIRTALAKQFDCKVKSTFLSDDGMKFTSDITLTSKDKTVSTGFIYHGERRADGWYLTSNALTMITVQIKGKKFEKIMYHRQEHNLKLPKEEIDEIMAAI